MTRSLLLSTFTTVSFSETLSWFSFKSSNLSWLFSLLFQNSSGTSNLCMISLNIPVSRKAQTTTIHSYLLWFLSSEHRRQKCPIQGFSEVINVPFSSIWKHQFQRWANNIMWNEICSCRCELGWLLASLLTLWKSCWIENSCVLLSGASHCFHRKYCSPSWNSCALWFIFFHIRLLPLQSNGNRNSYMHALKAS